MIDDLQYSESTLLQILSNQKINDKTGCWEWQGTIGSDGYGRISYLSRTRWAHKVAYMVFNDSYLPVTFKVKQTCGNRSCVNPDHLIAQNMRTKGNNPRGSKHALSKLDEDAVRSIRKEWNKQKLFNSQNEFCLAMALEYGVCKSTIQAVVTRTTWKHI